MFSSGNPMAELTPLTIAYPTAPRNSYLQAARADRGPYGILTPSYGITDPVAAAQARAAAGTPQVAVNNLGTNVPANFMGQSFRDAVSSNPSVTAVQSNVANQVNAMNVMEIAAQFLLGGGLLCAVLAK